jgi:hypothetical protein
MIFFCKKVGKKFADKDIFRIFASVPNNNGTTAINK